MADTTFPNTGMTDIAVGGSENTWGDKLDANFLLLDGLFSNTSGHDHSGAGKGSPIPSGGLKSLTNASEGLVHAVGDGTFNVATAGAGITITAGAIAAAIHALTAKTTLVDADEFYVADSAAAFATKKVTRANLLTGAILAGTPTATNNIGAANGVIPLAMDTYGFFAFTANGNFTLTPSGMVAGKTYFGVLEITNGGSFTPTYPAGSKFPGGITPSLSPAGTDLLFWYTRDGGTTYRWAAEIDSR